MVIPKQGISFKFNKTKHLKSQEKEIGHLRLRFTLMMKTSIAFAELTSNLHFCHIMPKKRIWSKYSTYLTFKELQRNNEEKYPGPLDIG